MGTLRLESVCKVCSDLKIRMTCIRGNYKFGAFCSTSFESRHTILRNFVQSQFIFARLLQDF